MKNFKTAVLAISVIAALSGCESLHSGSFDGVNKEADKIVNPTIDSLKGELKPQRGAIGQEFRGQHYVDANDYELGIVDNRKLPPVFRKTTFMSASEKAPMTIEQFAAEIFQSYKVIVDVSDPALQQTSVDGEVPPTPSNIGVTADTTGSIEKVASVEKEQTSFGAPLIKLKTFEFGGTLEELLDYVSVLNNIKWKFDKDSGKIYFIKHEIATFFVYDFAHERTLESRITTETSVEGGDSTGGSQKELQQREELTPWDDIKTTVETMIGESGNASFDRKTGLVSVSSSDYIISRVGNYINEINDASTQEISIAFRLVRVKVSEGNEKSINVNYLNNLLKGKFAVAGGLGELSPDILGNASSLQEVTKGNFLTVGDGSFQALIGALNSIGTASVDAYDYVDMLNNEVYNNQGSKNQEFIASIERSVSNSDTGRDTVTTERDVAVDGLNLSLKPRVIGDRIVLDYSISSSTFDGFVDAGLGSGLEGIKLKNDSTLDLSHKAILRNGQTRVLVASSKEEKTSNSEGPVSHNAWFFGGNESDLVQKEVTLITVTASYAN
tara:strand:+ start:7460 stop:9124 length:1665 start_codon:yes stop_codon:yes gene_type:complete